MRECWQKYLIGMRKGPWPTVNVTADEAGRIFHPAFESATEALDIHRPPKSKSHRNEQEIHSNTWTTRELDLFGVTESLSTRDTSSFRNCRILQAKEKKMEVRHACQIPHLPSAHPHKHRGFHRQPRHLPRSTFNLPKVMLRSSTWYAPHLWQDFV